MSNTFNFNDLIKNIKTTVVLEDPIRLIWTLSVGKIGQLAFVDDQGIIRCFNDGLSKEEIKNILCTLVDNCELVS